MVDRRTVLLVGSTPAHEVEEQLAQEGFAIRRNPDSAHPLFAVADDPPDVVLLLDSGSASLEVCAELGVLTPRVPVVIREGPESSSRFMDAVRAGAVGYLEAASTAHDIARACRVVADGGTAFSARLTTRLVEWARDPLRERSTGHPKR